MKKSHSQLLDLTGKKAIVTGGAMGIGESIAERLAEAGSDVLVADIAPDSEIEDSIERLKGIDGGRIEYLKVDISKYGSTKKIVDHAVELFGDVDILVNNAGIFKYMPADSMTEEMWDKTIGINLKALAFLSKEVVNLMEDKGHGGSIVNISSVDGIHPTGNLAHYDASKGGVNMYTKALAKEVGKLGIRVNAVAPGGVATPGVTQMTGGTPTEEEAKAMQAQMEQFIQAIPLQRMGDPEEIANLTLFLASDASSYMTGSIVVADGGLLLM